MANGGSAYCSGRSWTDATPSSESEQGEATGLVEDPTIKAAYVVCRVLILNAWRRRRAEIAQLEQQVEHLHLQIEFLRRLLLAENDRVGRLNGELHREKSQLEEMTRERDAVRSVRSIDYSSSRMFRLVSELLPSNLDLHPIPFLKIKKL